VGWLARLSIQPLPPLSFQSKETLGWECDPRDESASLMSRDIPVQEADTAPGGSTSIMQDTVGALKYRDTQLTAGTLFALETAIMYKQ